MTLYPAGLCARLSMLSVKNFVIPAYTVLQKIDPMPSEVIITNNVLLDAEQKDISASYSIVRTVVLRDSQWSPGRLLRDMMVLL